MGRILHPLLALLASVTRQELAHQVAYLKEENRMEADDLNLMPKCVMRDNDTKFSAQFDEVFKTSGVEIKRTVPLSPNLRAHVERFIQSLKFEVLDHLVIVAERHLNYVNREWRLHYNRERPHEARGHLPPGMEKPPETNDAIRPIDVVSTLPYLDKAFGNPSSLHWAGLPARDAVEEARSQVAALLCCDATEVVFTSGGTEANNHVIKGLFFARRAAGQPFHVITSPIEHPAVLEPCRFIERLGAEVTRLPVDRFGQVNPADVADAIRPHTALISIMHANNEVGTIQPIAEIAQLAHEHGVLCHTDAAQTVGKIPTDVETLGVDLLTVAGHKLYGPKGVGALFVREGVTLEPLLHGAGHEAGRRAGTENVLEIVGLGAACELAQDWIDDDHVRVLRDELWQRLQEQFGDRVVLNGHPTERLPNTFNVSFLGHHGYEILARLPNLAASTGSACHAGSTHISPVLAAMRVPHDVGIGAIRFSLGRQTTHAEIAWVVEALGQVVEPVPNSSAWNSAR
jgi:cysteine desulfurase